MNPIYIIWIAVLVIAVTLFVVAQIVKLIRWIDTNEELTIADVIADESRGSEDPTNDSG